MSSTSGYRYWAFVSYSHHDARVAREVMRRLELLDVPAAHRGRVHGESRHFEPNFLDVREAAAATALNDELRQAMVSSASLVVLCSPFSTRSPHVEEEVRFFLKQGREADIVCMQVSGVPDAQARGADPALECFPLPLRERPSLPLAASLGTETEAEWRHAMDQVTAGMLHEPLEHRRTWLARRRRRREIVAAAGAGTIALSAGALAWALWVPQHQFARDSVRRWGAWEPVGTITAAQAVRRAVSLRFTRRGASGPWTEVDWVDAHGRCAGLLDRSKAPLSIVDQSFAFTCTRAVACGVRIAPSDDGTLKERIVDQKGRTLETLSYHDAGEAIIDEAVVGCSQGTERIQVVKLERKPDGSDQRLTFQTDGQPRPNSEYAFGLLDTRDAQRRLVERTLLGADGQPRVGARGYATIHYDYDAAGNTVGMTTFGLDGKPTASAAGYASTRYSFDSAGNVIGARYLDAAGQPTSDAGGVYEERYRRRDDGNLAEIDYLGADGRLTPASGGIAIWRYEELGGPGHLRISSFDVNGQPTLDATDGCAAIDVDEREALPWQERRCYGLKGEPSFSKNGWHLERTDYDASDRVTAESYFGVHDQAVLCRNEEHDTNYSCPVYHVTNLYDKQGRRTGARLFGLHGEPVMGADGNAGFDVAYDVRGRIARWTNVGLDGRPAPNGDGQMAYENVYDDYDRSVDILFVDENGRPRQVPGQRASTHTAFDERGNEILNEDFDLEHQPIARSNGVASKRATYDERGRLIDFRTFDALERPVADPEGWFGIRWKYDAWGRGVLATRLGPDGDPQAGPDGVLSRRFVLDAHGYRTRLELLDVVGRPTVDGNGIAAWTYDINDRGQVLHDRRRGPLGQLVPDSHGIAGTDRQYDGRGNETSVTWIGADGQARSSPDDARVVTMVQHYDERDRRDRQSFLDSQGRPVADASGIYAYTFRYDDRDLMVEMRRLDVNGALVAGKDGMARVEHDYDASRGKLETRQFDAKGGAPLGSAAIVRYRNDPYGRELERTFFDAGRHPKVSPASGRWRVATTRDVLGRIVLEESFGVDDRPVDRKDTGWSRRSLEYGDFGQVVRVRCTDVRGVMVATCSEFE